MYLILPSGNQINIPGYSLSVGPGATASYPPTIANNGLMGAVTAGSMNPYLSSTYGVLLIKNDNGTTVGWERMTTLAAVSTAITNVGTAVEAGTNGATLSTAGVVTAL